jgi:hypothetical protein
MEKEYLTLRFEGDSYIDFGTFFKQVENLRESFATLSNNLVGDSKNVHIKVVPFTEGSFIFNFLIEYSELLLNITPLTIGIGQAYISILNLKKQLSGTTPLSITPNIDQTVYTVESSDGTKRDYPRDVVDIYTKNEVQKSISDTYKQLEKNLKDRGGVKVYVRTPSGRTIGEIDVTQQDIPNMAKTVDISEYISKRLDPLYSTQWLTLGDIDFLGKTKQVFLDLTGNKLIAEIEDIEFLDKKLKAQIIFKAGMKLNVKLRIEQIYVPLKKTTEYSFFIEKVFDINYNDSY